MTNIKEKSKIFGCGTNPKKITKWHEAINQEARELALKDPMLVLEKAINKFLNAIAVHCPPKRLPIEERTSATCSNFNAFN